MKISVLMPALNEAKNIEAAMANALGAFDSMKVDGELLVINDGSTDATAELVSKLAASDKRVRLLNHETPQGIGASFWDGADNASGDVVVMLPGDNENDPWEIFRYYRLLEHVDVVIPFLYNKEVRSLFRNALSLAYRFIINTTFLVYFNYTNGTVLYRKSILKGLPYRSTGFFFQTDILIRLVKAGYLFAEVPYRLGLRKSGVSKAVSFPSLVQVIKGYIRLVKDQYISRKAPVPYTEDSQTLKRRDRNMADLILDGHKLLSHRDRVEAWLRGERVAPITIDCSLTRACNYKCVYCYGQLQTNDEKRMTKEVIFRFLDDAAEIGVKGISFVSDGESTCSPHLYDAILHGKQRGLDMAVGTNGYLLKDERLEEILPALTYLRFNISAGEKERYTEIMGCPPNGFDKVCGTIRKAVEIKRRLKLPVTIGMQMVLMPQFSDQILPLSKLGKDLGADYLVIKHCSDDEDGSLKVDYDKYSQLEGLLKQAEAMTTPEYRVKAKWSKIMSGGKRCYSKCFGPPFIIQLSGSGLVAPCGMLFNSKYSKYHIGNIADTRFKDLWKSERYWEVMNLIASDKFDARTMCGTLCLQHKVNEFLWKLKEEAEPMPAAPGREPQHKNFI